MKIRDGKNYYSNSGKADTGGAKIGKLQKDGRTKRLLILFVGIVFTFLAPEVQSREINVAAVVKPRYIQLGEKTRLDLTNLRGHAHQTYRGTEIQFPTRFPRRSFTL